MPAALVIGARHFGFAIIERLLGDGWSVTGAARSAETLARVRGVGARALEVDVTGQGSVLEALEDCADHDGRLDLVVNAASPYSARRDGGPFGGGVLADAASDAFDSWSVMPARGAFAFLSASARFALAQTPHSPMTILQVTGGSARRGMPGRGPWAAGAFAVRALTQAAAQELRPSGIHVALLIVDAVIDRTGEGDASTADQPALADAVAYLASQSPRAMTHELQVTPALDSWTP
ncbi:MAG TPA: SDR family oxidoreductase [Solirubrobacteraceae bacterium]|nr:SDR family oxidoreductase [Solirubrobacteraceae bacterium]